MPPGAALRWPLHPLDPRANHMRASHTPRRHVRNLARVSVVALLAGLLNVVAATPALAATPFGDVNEVESLTAGRVHIRGWAIDSDNVNAAVDVHIYFGPTGDYGYNLGPAQRYRPDVGQAYPAGDYHGFDTVIDVPITGTYDWRVYLIDAHGGPNPMIESGQVTILADTTPPETTITSAPATATPTDVIRVEFTASEPKVTFQCQWDETPWASCPGSTTISLPPGNHIIRVRATDAVGNIEPDPATWVVAVSEYATQPPLPPGRTLAVGAVKKKSRLRVNVDPDSAENNYAVAIQRKVAKKWRTVSRVRTRGSHDVVVVDLRRGKYRAVLPKSASGPAVISDAVRLRR